MALARHVINIQLIICLQCALLSTRCHQILHAGPLMRKTDEELSHDSCSRKCRHVCFSRVFWNKKKKKDACSVAVSSAGCVTSWRTGTGRPAHSFVRLILQFELLLGFITTSYKGKCSHNLATALLFASALGTGCTCILIPHHSYLLTRARADRKPAMCANPLRTLLSDISAESFLLFHKRCQKKRCFIPARIFLSLL